jgi:hypothetical protein
LPESWASDALALVLPMATAQRICARGARPSGVAATFARRDRRTARLVVWAPGAGGDPQTVGTVAIRWRSPAAGEATIGELSWSPTRQEADLWRALEELAGHPIPR